MDKQQVFDDTFEDLKTKYPLEDALEIAKRTADEYEPEKVQGKKSFALNPAADFQGNILDVLVGYKGLDTEAQFGGRRLDDNGWDNVPDKEMTADINHFTYDTLNGEANDLDDRWHHFGVKVRDWYKSGDELRAKAYVPDNELGKEFTEKYKNGELGVSIEYEGDADENVVRDWEITGLTFHEDPSYIKTKK